MRLNSLIRRLRRRVKQHGNGDPIAPWLDMIEAGTFPMGHDPSFNYAASQIPLPNETLRQTVSRPDYGGFYLLGESWAYLVLRVLASIPDSGYRVLDVGCGVGKMARFLALDTRVQYDGFDIFKPAIEWSHAAFQGPVGDRFRFYHFDGVSKFYNPDGRIEAKDYQFPVPDSSIDSVFAASVFTHLYHEDMEAYLRQCARVLTPKGRAILSIKESAGEDFVGTEQSIRMTRNYFTQVATENGLSFVEFADVIGGQLPVIFKKS